jgi:hypothetical protein
MRNVSILQLLLLVLQSLSLSLASASASDSVSTSAPWWEAPHLTFSPVDPDFSWEKRRTGVTDYWKAGLAVWAHYNRTALENVSHKTSTSATCHPIPWTTGLMLKCLRQINETAFELHSVYEPSAVGNWMGGAMKTRPQDGLMEHGHVFLKTPYRVSYMPMQLPDHWPEDASSSRVTIVQPDAATVSCPRWLPNDEQSDELLQGGNYVRYEFAELWLAEAIPVNNNDENDQKLPDALKVGLFCQYNGVTGELMQVFRMREVALPEDLNPDNPVTNPLDLVNLQATLEERNWPAWTDRAHLKESSSPAAQQLASGAPVASILKQAGWTRLTARVVQTESPAGPEVACTVENAAVDYADPVGSDDQELYWHVRCSDGVYFRIPKTFHPTYLNEGVCMELGCLTRTGLQRVLVLGSRSQGGLHTTVHERWTAPAGESADE